MSYLFHVENNVVKPTTEVLLIPVFAAIWERDKSRKKEIAIQEFTYIEFITSFKKTNPFREVSEDKRKTVVKKEVIKEKNWKEDNLIVEAMEYIKKLQTEASTTYSFWLASKQAIEKHMMFLQHVNPRERNEKTGGYIFKLKDVPEAIAYSEKVLNSFLALREKAEEEMMATEKIKSNKEISPFQKN